MSRIVFLAVVAAFFGVNTLTAQIDLTLPAPIELLGRYDAYVLAHAPADTAYVAVQRIAQRYIQTRQWGRAAGVFQEYRTLFPDDKRLDKVIALLRTPDGERPVVSNLGASINTEAEESSPVLTFDGRTIYFKGRGRRDGLGGEDIFISTRHDGRWLAAENLSPEINTFSHEGPQAISADGTRLFLFGNYPGSLGEGDIFYVDRKGDSWGEIVHLPAPINSRDFEGNAYLSTDGKALFFASDRPGGIGEFHRKEHQFHGDINGNTDLYVTVKTDSGWSAPINLGPTINTPYGERTPFLHPDGKTLYFSSDGHYGLGSMDVFKSKRLRDDSWTEWSEPVNLGREINGAGDDRGFRITTAGDMAFFSATDRPDGFGGWDLYSITLPREARPEGVATIVGRVTDSRGQGLAATIRWNDLESGQQLGEMNSSIDGRFFLTLPLGRNYEYYADRKGYYPASRNVDLRGGKKTIKDSIDILIRSLDEIRRGASIRLENIFFDNDSYVLRRESYAELDRLASFLKERPALHIEVSGHTDNRGRAAYNVTLSQRRAASVVEYLGAAGVPRKNLTAKGYGKARAAASNETAAGRALNRRVEIKELRGW